MTFGLSQGDDNGWSWTTVVFVAGTGVLLGAVLLSGLGKADKCPRLRISYQRSLTTTGEERKLADWYLQEAQSEGCRWARRWPFTADEE